MNPANHTFKQDFVDYSMRYNRRILRLVTVFAILIELFNMMRVLLFTNAKLSTLNNRIYFSFYAVLFVLCLAFLIVDFGVKLSPRVRYVMYMAGASIFILWHTLFNMYDIYRAHAEGNITITTALVAFSALFLMRPGYALCNLIVNYGIFACFLSRTLSSGEVINFTITVLLCIVIYLVRYWHMRIELEQKRTIEDIHQELTETKQKFQLSREQYELIREKGAYITFEWDVHSDVIRFSKEWKEWFGMSEVIPQFENRLKKSDVVSKQHKEDLLECMENIRAGVHFQKHELLLTLKTGEKRWFEVRIITQTDAQGEPAFGIGLMSDIVDQKERVARLERELQMDSFTDTLNKTVIENYGKKKIKERRPGEALIMLILDMDDFKNINDSFGHPVGDYVLKSMAELMRSSAPKGAKIGRLGGDEFIVLLAGGSLEDMREYAERLIEQVASLQWHGADLGASCSIGIAVAQQDWSYAMLYEAADSALYQAKKAGKRRLHCYRADEDFCLLP